MSELLISACWIRGAECRGVLGKQGQMLHKGEQGVEKVRFNGAEEEVTEESRAGHPR